MSKHFPLSISTPTEWHRLHVSCLVYFSQDGEIAGFTREEIVFLDSGFSLVVFINYDGANPHTLVVAILNAVCSAQLLSSSCG